MVPTSVLKKFTSILEDDDTFNEAVMKVALETVSYYAGGETLTEEDYQLAYQLAAKVSVG